MADIRRFLDGRTRTYDADLLIGATGHNYQTSIPGKGAKNASTTAGTDGYIDIGEGYTQGFAVFDFTTIGAGATPAVAAGGNVSIFLQGGKSTTFATAVPLSLLQLGDAAISTLNLPFFLKGNDQVSYTRYFVPFHNRYGDQMYRYVRMFVHLGGSMDTISVNGYLTGLH